jgi:hypothetical protein
MPSRPPSQRSSAYQTQPQGEDVQKVNDALTAMQEAGVQMFADMGLSDYAWQ